MLAMAATMNQTLDPSRYPRPARTGPPLAAKVLIAVALIGIAAALGWAAARLAVPHREGPSPGPRQGAWSFSAVSAARICKADGDEAVKRSLLAPAQRGPLPARLSDHMPDASPIDAFERAYDGPVTDLPTPWKAALAPHGLIEGYARTFNSQTRAGGFTVYAYAFPNRRQAAAGAAAAYRTLVCDFGADPQVVREQPGIAAAIRPSQSTVAWWVHGRRLIEVDYSMFGEDERDVSAALTVLRTVWNVGREQEPSTSTA